MLIRTRTFRLLMGSAFASGLACAALMWSIGSLKPAPVPAFNFYGHDLPVPLLEAPAAHQATQAGIRLKTECSIGAFGVAPWLAPGRPRDAAWEVRTRHALAVMGLTPAAVGAAVAAMRSGRSEGVLQMSNTHGLTVTGPTRLFLPVYSTTFRVTQPTVCHGSRTAFTGDERTEAATLHRIAADGRVFWVGEFLACGNVSRFFEAAAGWRPRPAAGVPVDLPEVAPPDEAGLLAPIPMEHEHAAATRANVHRVPEPSTLSVVLAGLAVMAGGGALGIFNAKRNHRDEPRT